MTLTLKLTPEMETRLREEAARRGVSVPQFVKDLLEERLPEGDGEKGRSRTFQEWAANHNIDNPLLAEEALKRERG